MTRESTMAIVKTMATASSRVHRRIVTAPRKRSIASSRSIGMDEITTAGFHSDHASKRIWRTRTFSLGAASGESHFKYSRIHCFAKIPSSAAARLNTRLRKKSALIQRSAADAPKGGEPTSEVMVALRESDMGVGVTRSWSETLSARSWLVVSVLSSWSDG